jgi:Protein of unknown function (DUF3300)
MTTIAQTFRRLVALSLALLLLPAEMLAQQGYNTPYPQYPQQNPDQQAYSQDEVYPQQQANYPEEQPVYGPAAQPLTAQQLEQLVAPIALYPDALVAQVLTAATYPEQVMAADRWRQAQGYAPAEQIAGEANAQAWDPSVKSLTAFPQVLAEMVRNQQWMADLGAAYFNQPQDILQAVQVMRQRAQAAGNLQNTPQETVNYDQGNIELAPANPQVVYVPAYNPWAVYGAPISPYPGFSLLGALGSFLGSTPVSFGLGTLMTAFNQTPFGFIGWGLSWLTSAVLFHQSSYCSRSTSVTDWGFAHGGRRAFQGGGYNRSYYGQQRAGYNAGYGRSPGYNRGYTNPGVGFARSGQSAYSHMQPAVNSWRGTGSAYGNSFYGNRPGGFYGGGQQAYNRMQAPAGFARNGFPQRAPSSFKGNTFAGYKPPKQGGFHPFGGGGHSFGGGGHSFGGGGHSFGGGGHSFGGGHSGGGGGHHMFGKHH